MVIPFITLLVSRCPLSNCSFSTSGKPFDIGVHLCFTCKVAGFASRGTHYRTRFGHCSTIGVNQLKISAWVLNLNWQSQRMMNNWGRGCLVIGSLSSSRHHTNNSKCTLIVLCGYKD